MQPSAVLKTFSPPCLSSFIPSLVFLSPLQWMPQTHMGGVLQQGVLEGRDSILFTDNKPLIYALFRTTPPWSALQQRQLSYISEFTSNIIHLPGVENCVADALSCPSGVHPSSSSASPSAWTLVRQVRISPSLIPVLLTHSFPPENQLSALGYDFSVLPPLQPSCPSVQSMLTNPSLEVLPVHYSDSAVLSDVPAGSLRPLVPTVPQKQLFSAIHRISHPEVQSSKRLISFRLAWHGQGHSLSTKQDPDPCQIIGSQHSSSCELFCSYSH